MERCFYNIEHKRIKTSRLSFVLPLKNVVTCGPLQVTNLRTNAQTQQQDHSYLVPLARAPTPLPPAAAAALAAPSSSSSTKHSDVHIPKKEFLERGPNEVWTRSFPKCLFPDLIVWYFLMGARFLFNTYLMHVSHQDKTISSSSYISKPINVACAVHFWAGGTRGWTVWGKWRKERKVAAQRREEQLRVELRVLKHKISSSGDVSPLQRQARRLAIFFAFSSVLGPCPTIVP